MTDGNSLIHQMQTECHLQTVRKYVPSVSPNDDIFLKRLYAAFDVDNNKSIDFGYDETIFLFFIFCCSNDLTCYYLKRVCGRPKRFYERHP